MIKLNFANIVRAGLLGGIEATAAAMQRGHCQGEPRQAARRIMDSLQHLEAIGLGDQEVVAERLSDARKFGPIAGLIDTYKIAAAPQKSVKLEDYVSTHRQELLSLIGALFMVDASTVAQSLATVEEFGMEESGGMTCESRALQLFHVSLQLHNGFRDPRDVLNAEGPEEDYEILIKRQAIFGPTLGSYALN